MTQNIGVIANVWIGTGQMAQAKSNPRSTPHTKLYDIHEDKLDLFHIYI